MTLALTRTTTICRENLLTGTGLMSTVPPAGGLEPSHVCETCRIPLWQYGDVDWATCTDCGEEATPVTYCRTCDAPNCRNTGH